MAAPGSTPQGFGAHWLLRQQLGGPGEVYTFYSYKGGTGRSMGMVNCAGLIAQHLPSGAKPLLLIDFDLEAPGLHRYLAPLVDAQGLEGQAGVLDLFDALRVGIDAACAERGVEVLDDERVQSLVAAFDLAPFKLPVRLPQAATGAPVAMELIVAGRFDADYDARLQRFDWPGLYAKAPALFRALSERLSREHSFVFVDSRTGLSDTSGISTMLLPDVLVVVFTPNTQSLTGIEHLVRKAVEYRAGATDLRPLRIYPLPSRVDNQVEHFRRVWRMGDAAHPLFGAVQGYQPLFTKLYQQLYAVGSADAPERLGDYFDQVQVPHTADYAFGERLCFTDQASGDSLSIRGAYELFLPWIVTGAQPWQRPADLLADLQASIWLRDAGVAEAPANDSQWPEWFDRLARLASSAPLDEITAAAIDADRRFDIHLTRSLALAHVGDYTPARAALDAAAAVFGEESATGVADEAPVALLRLQLGDPPPPESRSQATAWLEAFDQLMARWQPLKVERRRWLQALLPLAQEWASLELVWRATVELEGARSEAALLAQLAAAAAREAEGNLKGAIELLLSAVPGEADSRTDAYHASARAALSRIRTRLGSESSRPLPQVADCDQLVWICDARDDDAAWFNWNTQFREELDRGVRARLRGVRLPTFARSPDLLQGAGRLGDELQRQIGRSFAFILMAGENAAQSEWCQRETEAFLQMYGRAALERLYIVALSESAVQRVLSWPFWSNVVAREEVIYIPFFDQLDRERPLDIYIAPGLISPAFRLPFDRLREKLVEAVSRSVAMPKAAPLTPPTKKPTEGVVTLYVESNREMRSLWQPVGEYLREQWEQLRESGAIEAPPLRVRGLPMDDLGKVPLADADGIVLLWGQKTPEALLAQIDAVEARLENGLAGPAQGIVAYLSPPREASSEPVPAWGWPVVRVSVHEPDAPRVHDGDAEDVNRFLRKLAQRAQRRSAAR